MPSDCPPKVVLVTGTSSGIGLALADKLWLSDYRVVITARRESLPKLADKQFENTERFLIRPLDVTLKNERTSLLTEIAALWGGVDILINNAGVSYRSVIEHMSEDDEQLQFACNYFGPMGLIRLVLPYMRQRGWGRIVNVSSVGGMMAMPTMGSYSASKFALEGASEALWYELRPWDIGVSLVQPGFVRSNSFQRVLWSKQAKESLASKKPYHEYYEQMNPFIERLMNAAFATSDSVAEKILATISRDKPPLRVPATLDAHFFSVLRRVLPRRIYHWLLYAGLPGVKKWRKVDENKF